MKRALVAVLVIVVIAAVVIGGVYATVVRPILLPPPAGPGAESALATPDVLMLAAINVRQAAFLERWYLGTPVIPATHEALPPPRQRTLLQHLRAVNVNLRRDVDYALWTLYPSNAPALRHALLLLGRFDPGAIGQYVTRELGATTHAEAGWTSYDITRTDPTNCQASTTWRLTTDARWILLSDAVSHPSLLLRLTTVPEDSAAIVSWWHPLAQWDVVGVGVWNLPAIDTRLAHPLLKASAEAAETVTAPFEHAYVGLGIGTAPPGGRLRVVLDSPDPARAAEKIATWRQAVAASRARWVSALPSLGALYDRLSVTTSGGRSTIAFGVDRRFASNLRQVGNEIIGAVLGGFGVRSSISATPSPRAERIDSSPFNFQASASAAALPSYDPTVQFAEDVDQISGPFGVRVAAIRLGSVPDVGLEVTVEAFANQIPNVSGTAQNARLLVESVKSADGTELLRPEDCGRERNAEPVALTEAIAPRLRGAKTVRLTQGADPRALASVAGHVELQLPTRTETVSLPHPGPGSTARKNGATLTITDVNGGSVSYQISGPRGRILAVRALNAKGQPLATESSFTADFVFGDGEAGETAYAGSVERVDVVFATEEQALRFPFTLTDFSFTGKSAAVVPDTAPAFQGYSAQAIGRALNGGPQTPRAARPAPGAAAAPKVFAAPPFELSLDRTQSFITLVLDFTVRSAALPDFERAFTVGELEVTRLRLTDGSIVEPNPIASTAPIRFGGAAKDGALTARIHVTTDAKVNPEMVAAVEGRLAVQFPRTLETLRLADLRPGETVRSPDFDVTVTGRGRRSLTLQTSKDGQRLLYVRLLSAEGQPLAFFGPLVAPFPDGTWRFELSPLSSPHGAEVVVARTLYRKEYPFVVSAH